MLDSQGFNDWAGEYDESIAACDARGEYPFAGYRQVLKRIETIVLEKKGGDVLDLGFGTAALTKPLYDAGCRIYGQDFSEAMLAIAGKKMPEAELYLGDFFTDLALPLTGRKYDFILATYCLHHLSSQQKTELLKRLQGMLKPDGLILIGDISFKTAADQEACRKRAGDGWDEEEVYIVYEELVRDFPQLTYERVSFCGSVFTLTA